MARRTENADILDKYIGAKIREQRENLGITQTELAHSAGVSYQQIHKYESGSNRISAGRLGVIAQALNLPVQSFFEGIEAATAHAENEKKDSFFCLEFARNFRQIDNPRHQQAMHMLVRVLAN